jgi:hypothetical protein
VEARGLGRAAAVVAALLSGVAPIPAVAATKDPWTGQELAIDVPKSGTSSERIRTMWQQARAIIVKDAAANLTDEQYHAKRDAMFLPWTHLQEALYQLDDAGSEKAKSAVPLVLSAVDDLYGFGGEPQPRIETRDTFKKAIDARLAKIDEAVKALP